MPITPNNPELIRAIVFFSCFTLFGILETLWPKRKQSIPKKIRWTNNYLLNLINILTIKGLIPITLIGLAINITTANTGLFNLLNLPFWLNTTLSLILLDLYIYAQHIMVHKVPLFWRFHRVHHTDLELDVSSGFRFHVIEIIGSWGLKALAILILGCTPLSVFLFELLLNGVAMFNHSNIHLPKPMDTLIRKLIVTPDMHRIHHSALPQETDSNYGFNLAIWDHLFKTHIASPQQGHQNMTIGLKEFQNKKWNLAHKLLILPFLRKK